MGRDAGEYCGLLVTFVACPDLSALAIFEPLHHFTLSAFMRLHRLNGKRAPETPVPSR